MIKLPDEMPMIHACRAVANATHESRVGSYQDGWSDCLAEGQRLNATAQPVSDGCKWSFDDDGYWGSACGSSWVFKDGGPIENKCNFCQKCGGKVMLAAEPGGQDD